MRNDYEPRRLNVFECCLTLCVGLCMVIGVGLGKLGLGVTDALRRRVSGTSNPMNVIPSRIVMTNQSEQIA